MIQFSRRASFLVSFVMSLKLVISRNAEGKWREIIRCKLMRALFVGSLFSLTRRRKSR